MVRTEIVKFFFYHAMQLPGYALTRGLRGIFATIFYYSGQVCSSVILNMALLLVF
jgi:hypothetical protein